MRVFAKPRFRSVSRGLQADIFSLREYIRGKLQIEENQDKFKILLK